MADLNLTGGCLCGEVRFRIAGPLISCNYCHCTMCRKASGAPVAAFATFAAKDFSFTKGQPAAYSSSERAVREFCPSCGSQLTWHEKAPGADIHVSIGALDDPGQMQPTDHIWTASRVPWFEIADTLPRYRAERFSEQEDNLYALRTRVENAETS